MKEQDNFFLIHSPGDYELWKLCKLLVEAAEWRPEPGGDSGVVFDCRIVTPLARARTRSERPVSLTNPISIFLDILIARARTRGPC